MAFEISKKSFSQQSVVFKDIKTETIGDKVGENEKRDLEAPKELETPEAPDGFESPPLKPVFSGLDPKLPSYGYVSETNEDNGSGANQLGMPSLFNKLALLSINMGNSRNTIKDVSNYMDTGDVSGVYETGDLLSAGYLVQKYNDKDYPSKPYYYSDFAFSKWWNFIPENRLITVRRYPFPVVDNLSFPKHGDKEVKLKPIAQAVTYFGNPSPNTLKALTGIKGNIAFKELTASFDKANGNEQGSGDSPTGFLSGKIGNFASLGVKGISAINGRGDVNQSEKARIDYARNYDWSNQLRGKHNVIKKTYIEDNGLEAGVKSYDITFEYELRSYNGINPRVAMLDILANFLSLTYQDGSFWGGTRLYYPNSPRYAFLGGKKGQDQFYNGDYGGYMNTVMKEFSSAGGVIADTFKGVINAIKSGDLSSLVDMLGAVAGGGMDVMSGRNRPALISYKALLSGEPIGKIHLTIGNPDRPIAMIGNLICTDFKIELSEELGADDFPTGVTMTMTLKDGMPRDKTGIESIFNNGNGKLYARPKDLEAYIAEHGKDKNIELKDFKYASGSVF
jgi:hypothetical protein